ncbi:MAG TPA: RNA polymerase sigma factor [Alphaproteobacteria bacterium]|nr:RNA polymerase sigma factor [Alphaproteobacteria bacterium]
MAQHHQNQSEQWQEWAIAAQAGDKAAYAKLLGELAPYIKNTIIKTLSNQDAAEDIAQEVLISIHKSLDTYQPDKAFKPWLMAIVNFRRTDYLRKHYSQRQDKTTTMDENPEFIASNVTNSAHAGELKDIEAALRSLPEQQQRIFKMIKIEGFTTAEVANEMNMNESAVKVSAHRAMKKLQGLLK